MYKIEKSVPIPDPYEQRRKYPFSDMAPGDSFVVPKEKANAAQAIGRRFVERHRPDMQVVQRTEPDGKGVRVWLHLRKEEER